MRRTNTAADSVREPHAPGRVRGLPSLPNSLAPSASRFSSLVQLPVPTSEDLRLATFQLVHRRHVPDGTVKPNRVVMGHVLADQPTALVHEAFLKLVDQKRADYRSRGHFMAVAAMVMRRILVTHAERRAAAKRGGGAARVPLSDDVGATAEGELDLVALDEAMNKLARLDSRKAAIVEQRFFAGMEMSQIAENLGVSLSTVKRDWEYARTWLMREMHTVERTDT